MKRLIVVIALILAVACPGYAGEVDWLRVIGDSHHMGKTYFYDEIQINSGQEIDEFSTDGTFFNDSDTALPTEKAVKAYVDNNIPSNYWDKDFMVYGSTAWPDLENAVQLKVDTGLTMVGTASEYAINDATITLNRATASIIGGVMIPAGGSLSLNLGTGALSVDLAAGDTYTNFGGASDDTLDEMFAAIDVSLSVFKIDGTLDDDTYSGYVMDSTNAGEAIAQWDLVYMDDTANEWLLADANVAGKFPARGMAVTSCPNGVECVVLLEGTVRNAGWSAVLTGDGKVLHLSETPGGIIETAPSDSTDCVQHIGWVLSDTNDTIVFDPNTLWIVLE